MSVERVTISALFYSQICQNVLHFENQDGALTPAQVCAEIRDHWIGTTTNVGIHSWVTNSCAWVKVACQTRASSLAAPTELTINQPGQQSPDNQQYTVLSVILKFRTAAAGRKGRGRSYVPGIANGFTTTGLVNATFHTYADTAIAGLNARFAVGGTGPLYLMVGPRSGIVNNDFYPVTSIAASNFVGVQRRRNIGYGI
jgi:hypothetical protein